MRYDALRDVAEAAHRMIHVWDEPGMEGADWDLRMAHLEIAVDRLDNPQKLPQKSEDE